MSTKEKEELEDDNLLMSFADGFESFEEAQLRKEKEEAEMGNRPDITYFKMEKFGDYDIKVFPHHPESTKNGAVGYTTPVRQAWLKITKPGQEKPINVKVFSAKQAGFSEDLMSTYKYLAIGALRSKIAAATGRSKEAFEKILEVVDSSGFNGGLRFDFKHLMWILDMQNREKGLHMFECSNGIFKSLEDSKLTIWNKRQAKAKAKGKDAPCPVVGIVKGKGLVGTNNVVIQKIKNGKKTDYKVMFDLEEDEVEFTKEELAALIAAPKLPSFIYYNKRSFQATLIYLEQYDAKYELGVFSSEAFVEIVEKLRVEIDAVKDDTSSFDLNSTGKSDSGNDDDGVEGLTLDALLDEYDALVGDEISDGDDEMNDFRKKLRDYMKQEAITGIKIGRKDSTDEVLAQIEDFIEANGERGIVSSDVADEDDAEEEDDAEALAKKEADDKKAAVAEKKAVAAAKKLAAKLKAEEEEGEAEEETEEEPETSTRSRRSRAEPTTSGRAARGRRATR